MMNHVIIKLSGNVIADNNAMAKLVTFILGMRAHGKSVAIVHGGGKQINELSNRLKVPIQQMDGRRITNKESLEVLLYTVGGKVNRELVAYLRKNGIPATGITGIDGDVTTSRKRPPIDIDGISVDFGLVGEIESTDVRLLEHLMAGGFLPVIGCLTWSPDDGILNINADTFSIRISLELQAQELIMLMDFPAVLDAEQKPIATMNRKELQKGLKEGWIRDGMKPKLQTAFEALENGVASVRIANADTLASGGGTRITGDDI